MSKKPKVKHGYDRDKDKISRIFAQQNNPRRDPGKFDCAD